MMDDTGNIYHTGIVKSVSGSNVKVEVLTESACTSCEVSGSCEISGMKQKEVDVRVINQNYSPGEQVNIILTQKQGMLATFLGYIFPFILIFITLFLMKRYTENEVIMGLSALGILIPYYLILYLMKKQIKSEFGFKIEKLQIRELSDLTQ